MRKLTVVLQAEETTLFKRIQKAVDSPLPDWYVGEGPHGCETAVNRGEPSEPTYKNVDPGLDLGCIGHQGHATRCTHKAAMTLSEAARSRAAPRGLHKLQPSIGADLVALWACHSNHLTNATKSQTEHLDCSVTYLADLGGHAGRTTPTPGRQSC